MLRHGTTCLLVGCSRPTVAREVPCFLRADSRSIEDNIGETARIFLIKYFKCTVRQCTYAVSPFIYS